MPKLGKEADINCRDADFPFQREPVTTRPNHASTYTRSISAKCAKPELRFEFSTPEAPSNAGTALGLYFSVIFDNGANLAQSRTGSTGLGELATFDFEVTSAATSVRTASVRLNGLAPDANDNWLPNHVMISFGGDVLVDTPWDLPFDEAHRSHELYRQAFDSTRCDDCDYDRADGRQ